jgi:hypothetical protein
MKGEFRELKGGNGGLITGQWMHAILSQQR